MLLPTDVAQLRRLLRSERPPPFLFRVHGEPVYAAVVSDALRERDLMIVVAVKREGVVGFSIIAWNWRRLKTAFGLRHPVVGAAIVWSTLRRRLSHRSRRRSSTNTRDAPARIAANPKGVKTPSWEDADSSIAKVIHTAVAPEHRMQGIGSGLKSFYAQMLRSRGFRRVDARIDPRNRASLAMNRRCGWVLVDEAGPVFAFLDLDDTAGHG